MRVEHFIVGGIWLTIGSTVGFVVTKHILFAPFMFAFSILALILISLMLLDEKV